MSLTRKDLKVRYKNSALGFMWSMLNPLLYLLVFYIVFNIFLPAGVPKFHVYFLAGLLPWTFFSTSLMQATGSVTSNGSLVKKVYFPREMLPLSSIGAGLFHFFLQLAVLLGFLFLTRHTFPDPASWLLIPASLLVTILLVSGMSFITGAVNVKARDVQYFVELALLAWFWMTPIVYPSAMIASRLADNNVLGVSALSLYLANPMSRVALGFQRGIYGLSAEGTAPVLIDAPLSWYFNGLLYVGLGGLVLVVVGSWIFDKLSGDFAEDL